MICVISPTTVCDRNDPWPQPWHCPPVGPPGGAARPPVPGHGAGPPGVHTGARGDQGTDQELLWWVVCISIAIHLITTIVYWMADDIEYVCFDWRSECGILYSKQY